MSASEPNTTQQRTGRSFYLVLVFASLAWSVSSRLLSRSSAQGIANRFNADWVAPILGGLFLIFLLAIGYSLLEMIGRRPASARFVLGLPNRPTASREWLIGVALGWGIVTLAVLPMALAGDLHVGLWLQPRAFLLLVLNLVILAVLSLAQEAVYRGYPFHRLIDAIGPVGATIGMSALFALSRAFDGGASSLALLIAFLSGIVFSMAWLRTHGLWLSWGMRFGWMVSMGILFGLPIAGSNDYSTVVQTLALGTTRLTGDEYGPEASIALIFALIVGLIVLVRVTRTYAWDYTHVAIVSGGYPMDVAPPPAHTAMEQAAQAKPAPLVQILPTPPQGRSAGDPPEA